MKKPAKKIAKKTSVKKAVKKIEFQPTYVALVVSSIAVISLVAFAIIGSSMSM